ncbi:hypothetical protein A9K97_gp264 [Tokyovirus A1]|uniref:hypothetical protein n=1 Tax=Tokyovirus A1 TaxID=1826170 RepID=UPI0007A9764D|nr:hypothetical protein A9K97_gp264 [Tokyovirus A1]BAU80087.1 hypothetical protein [Tokyovirus A1]
MMNTGLIDLEPPYQREIVWNEELMSLLIQSMLLRINIGEITLMELGQDGYRSIDGKQRLTSIGKFMNNEIPTWYEKQEEQKIWYTKVPKNSRNSRVLTESERGLIDFYELTTCVYPTIPLERQKDIFKRLQYGRSLSSGEKLFAQCGDTAETMMVHLAPLLPKSCILSHQVKRKSYIIAFARLAMLISHFSESFGPPPNTYLESAKVLEWSKRKGYNKKLLRHSKEVLSLFAEFCSNEEKWTMNNPLLVYLGTYIFLNRRSLRKLEDEEKSLKILEMKKEISEILEKHKKAGAYFKGRCIKEFTEFCSV